MRQIVGALINEYVTNNPVKIISGLAKNECEQLLSKQEMEFMAAFDLGKHWEDMAKSPVLFLFDDKTGDIVLCQETNPA